MCNDFFALLLIALRYHEAKNDIDNLETKDQKFVKKALSLLEEAENDE